MEDSTGGHEVGRLGWDVPDLYVDPVRLEAQRVLDLGIRTPLPRSLYETEDADPTIRSAA